MASERSYRHDIRCRRCGSNWDAQRQTHTRASSSQARRLQAEAHGGSRAAALPGADQSASGSDAHRGREHICGARSGRKRCIGERLGQNRGAIALERMRAISAWRASGRVSTIVASTIALDEMWTYLGARKAEKRNGLRVWTAVVEERDGSRWMDFEAGGRDEATFLRLLERLPATRPTPTECMGHCRSTSMWLGSASR